MKYADGKDKFDLVIDKKAVDQNAKKKTTRTLDANKLEVHMDGPFGAPASNIFRYVY